ncbi:MAG: hypothetical protein IJ574_03005 [Bacilli bacterium]|nr:hypothetical protein [Bacilli bacterium]
MKKIVQIVLLMVLFIPTFIKAECSNEELAKYSSLAGQIKLSYEDTIEENKNIKVLGSPDSYAKYRVLNINVAGLSPELSIRINDDNKLIGFYNYNDTEEGKILIKNYDIDVINTYQADVFVNNEQSECNTNKIRTMYMSTPKFNPYSNYTICDGIRDKIVYCNTFVSNDFSEDKFFTEVNKYLEKNTDTKKNNESGEKVSINKKYGLYILGLFILVVIVVIFRKKVIKNVKKK